MIYSYADRSWHPVKGCDMSLPCAARCWAKRECHRLAANPNAAIAEFHQGLTDAAGNWTGAVKVNTAHLEDPLHWRKPARIAVAYHSDLFLAPGEVLDRVFAVMSLCPEHTFLVLTKRPEQMRRYLRDPRLFCDLVGASNRTAVGAECTALEPNLTTLARMARMGRRWPSRLRVPLRNVFMGVSCEDQSAADERIPLLLQTPAARRFVSLEPMVGPINLSHFLPCLNYGGGSCCNPSTLDAVIVGGESGRGARLIKADWIRDIRDQCAAARVPFWFKQWNRVYAGAADGAVIDGKQHREFPTFWGLTPPSEGAEETK